MAQRPFNMHVGIYTKTLCDDLRKCLLITLTLLFVCPGVWGEDKNVSQASDFGTVSNSRYTLTNDNTYILSANISISNYLYIANGSTVTIDLNGQTLNRNLASAVSNGFIIKNEGTLIILDSGTGGSITGGFNSGDGGGIYNNGNLTITGGNITSNRATGGGSGVYNTTSATFNISGKVIITGNTLNNTTTASNVYLPTGKKLNITGNLNADAGIGVTMSDGTGIFTEGLTTYSGDYTNFSADVSTTTAVKITDTSTEAQLISNWAHIQDVINHVSDGTPTTIQLESGKTYQALSSDSYLNIPTGKTITIDLNSRMLDRNLHSPTENGCVIKVESGGILTIGTGNGSITGGYNTNNGGGIVNAGTLTINKGNIYRNYTTGNGGGIYNSGNLTISGGTIGGEYTINKAVNGAGIYNEGTLTMTGGTIYYNEASGSGGGIYHANAADNTLNLSATPIVKNNLKRIDTYRTIINNIFLPTGKKITVTAALSGTNGDIGVMMETPGNATVDGTFTNELSAVGAEASSQKFKSDENYTVELYYENNVAKLRTYWSKIQQALNGDVATITLTESCYAHRTDGPLTVNRTVEINLNGWRLDRDLTEPTTNGYVIKNEGTLTLSGIGSIVGGYNNNDGGGIYNTGTLTLNGPESEGSIGIYGNNVCTGCKGGGIYNSGNLTLHGRINISGNQIPEGAINSNVYLTTGKIITINTSLSSSSNIGISHADNDIVFTSGLNWNSSSNLPFKADNNTVTAIGISPTGEAVIGTYYTITTGATTNGSITVQTKAVKGSVVYFSVSANDGYVPYSLSYTPSGETDQPISGCWGNATDYHFTMPAKNTTLNATFIEGGFCGNTGNENDMKYYLDGTTLRFVTKDNADIAMADNYDLTTSHPVPWKNLNYTAVSLSDHVTSISPYAFFGSTISSITIPSSVATIGAMALANCQSLATISVSGGSHFTSDANVLYTNGKTELVCYPAGLEASPYTLPNTVTTVRDGAFAYNTHLTAINVESGGIPSFSAPNDNGVLYNAGGTILYCYPARKEGVVYDVASTVTEIKPYAFHNNNLLKAVNFCETTVPTGGTEMFGNHNSQLRIMVKKDQGTNYKGAANWATYQDYIYEMNLANADVSLEYTTHKYEDTYVKPGVNSVKITVGGQEITLREDIDYVTISDGSYTNNNAVGTATVTVTGKNGYNETSKATNFTITRELIISGADNRYTYYASEDLTLPSHLTAWTYTNIDWTTGVMTPTQINYIPANVPVILYRSGASINETLYLTAHASESTTVPCVYFKGVSTDTDIATLKSQNGDAEYIYVLRGENFVRATSGTLPAKHCYFYKPSGTAAPSVLTTTFSALSGGSYKIETLNASNGTVTIQYDNSGTTTNVTVNNTEIPAGKTVTLTITPNDGFYLSALQCEEVSTLDVAMAPARRADKTQEIHEININTNYEEHFAGDYTFPMPRNNVIVTATFAACTSITSANLHWDSDPSSTNITYDGGEHTANVYLGSSDLTVDANYTIDTNKRTDVGSITPTITGVGTYCGTINNQTISITTKTLNIAAVEGQSKTYGDSDPTFAYTHTGLYSGDQISGALRRTEGEDAGTYAINIGTLTAGSNYNIAFTSKNFTINPKDLSAVALTISLDHDYFNYNGEVQKAEITGITYGNTTLNSGSDYNSTFTYGTGEYEFADNKTPDIYPITVTFTGNYTGSKTVEYQIRPKVTLNSSYRWMTYLEPVYNMEIPNSYKFSAHTVSGISTTSVTLTDRTQIRANVPMLLYRTGTTEETVFYPPLIKTPTDSWSGLYANYLWNSTEKAINTLISEHSNMDIWILVNDQFVRTKSGTLPANRGYLLKEKATGGGSSAPAMLPLVRGSENTTGVELIINNPIDNGDWYTLDGRKLQGRPTQKGVYINQGKKIYIK